MASSEVPLKVAVRLRPLVGRENPDQKCIRVQPDKKQIVLGKDRAFTFDYIFTPESSQFEIFEAMCAPLIDQCFQGYNGTVFAYGQTGSGKTHTIEGDIEDIDQFGIVPRSIKYIFDQMNKTPSHDFLVKLSFIEIYKEELHDLLDSENYPFKSLHIREDEKGNTMVINAKEVQCTSVEQVLAYAEAGTALRRTEATQMNERSSRSHSIFTLILEQKSTTEVPEGASFMSSKIHFVDLAGSERASKTGNIGERFKESIHINTGLLALGNVISALSDSKRKSGHIPYRDAKITRLLKDSLGGNSNTVMITCIPPTFANFDESLNSLKYANRAKNIRNKPIINRDSQSMRFEALQSEIMNLKEELEREKSSKSNHTVSTMDHEVNQKNIEQLQERLENATLSENKMERLLKDAQGLLNISMNELPANSSLKDTISHWLKSAKGAGYDGVNFDELTKNRIDDLETEVRKLREDLKLDEQIFQQKNKEMSEINIKVKDTEKRNSVLDEEKKVLTSELLKCQSHVKEQQQVIIELQKMVNEQTKSLEQVTKLKQTKEIYEVNSIEVNASENHLQPPRPAKSAPVRRVNDSSTGAQDFGRGDARNVYTSPAVYTMDKIVQSFRAKSQMLATQWEETDEVLREHFDDNGDEMLEDAKSVKLQRPLSSWSVRKGAKSTNFTAREASSFEDHAQGIPSSPHLLKLPEIHSLRASVQYSKDEIQNTNAQIREANKKMRELALAIRLKEEMIREMLKTGREAEAVNKALKEKFETAKKDDKSGTKKIAKSDFVSTIQNQAEKKVSDLTIELQKMKSQYDSNQKKLKDETDKKNAIEKDLINSSYKLKEMEKKLDHQSKILRRKSEEVSAMRKSRRQNMSPSRSRAVSETEQMEQDDLDKIIQKKKYLTQLEADLSKREELLRAKEEAIKEKEKIEIKKLRASQSLTGEVGEIARKVNSVEEKLQVASARGEKDVIMQLSNQRDDLLARRDVIDQQMRDGNVLSDNEERKLIELEEAVEMLEAAIDFKSDQIASNQEKVEALEQFSEPNLLSKVSQMGRDDLISLLTTYFGKVISLKETEKSLTLQEQELLIKSDEQERMIQELQSSLHQSKIEFDRRTHDIIREYETKTQLLLKQIQPTGGVSEKSGGGGDSVRGSSDADAARIKELERELYYYKKTSRDLKKKMRELAAVGLTNEEILRSGDSPTPMQPSSSRSQNSNDPNQNENAGSFASVPSHSTRNSEPRVTGTPQPHVLPVGSPRKPPINPAPLTSRSSKNVGEPNEPMSAKNSNANSSSVSVTVSRKELREITPSIELASKYQNSVNHENPSDDA